VKRVSIVNINNGERFETYIKERNSGEITLNGPARKVQKMILSLLSPTLP
jgi:aspartate 1-decarboxylase